MSSYFKTSNQRSLLDLNKFLKVELHQVEFTSGVIIDDWAWVITPDYINAVVINEAGEWLFFRQPKYAYEGLSLAPVGGYLEVGEAPLAAAQREVLEETGYQAPHWTALGSYCVDANRGAGTGHLFLAQGAKKVAERNADDLEEQELVWLSQAQTAHALQQNEFKVLAWSTVVALALLHLAR